ncbi:MAG: DUF393 domain-containing protein [Firmicutes bacterium]|nr:DUF393 domain-containing protein [Bacillota bacterium]
MAAEPNFIFYDGRCGVCHSFVQFVARRDRRERFHFAPLGGQRFAELIPPDLRTQLPESLVLRTPAGELYYRSVAVVRVLRELGGGWRLLALVLQWVPVGLRDALYNQLARIRNRLFRRPADVCPPLPSQFRARLHR